MAVATLVFLTFLEYNNSSPWHELQHPRLLKGLRVGPILAEGAAMLVVYCAISGLLARDRFPALASLLAPLAYPTVMQGFHRFQVRAKGVTQFRSWACVVSRPWCVFVVCVCGDKRQRKDWAQVRRRVTIALFCVYHPPAQRAGRLSIVALATAATSTRASRRPCLPIAGEAQERSDSGADSTSTAPRAPERPTQAFACQDARRCGERSYPSGSDARLRPPSCACEPGLGHA